MKNLLFSFAFEASWIVCWVQKENQLNVELFAPFCVLQYIGSSLYTILNNVEYGAVRLELWWYKEDAT
jgi:hypothetical protein